MILVTCHHEQMEPVACFLYHVHHVIHQTLEYVQVSLNAHIVHALRIVRTKSGPHTACQQHCTNLAIPNCLDTDLTILLGMRLYLGKLHRYDGCDHTLLCQILSMLACFQYTHIGSSDLIQQSLLLFLLQFLIILQDMLLSISLQLLLRLKKSHHCSPHFTKSSSCHWDFP